MQDVTSLFHNNTYNFPNISEGTYVYTWFGTTRTMSCSSCLRRLTFWTLQFIALGTSVSPMPPAGSSYLNCPTLVNRFMCKNWSS